MKFKYSEGDVVGNLEIKGLGSTSKSGTRLYSVLCLLCGSVAEEWLLFSNFKRDIVNVKNFEKSKDGWVLDKDLCSHTKTYSKETCCFIPDRLNLFISNLPQAYKAPYDKRFDVYYSYCNDVHGKRTYLGRYKSKEEACEAYLKFKALVFLDMIEFYKDDLDEKILTRLKNIGDNYCESVS